MDVMVWEVVTPAVLSSDPKHEVTWDSGPEGEQRVMMAAGGERSHDHEGPAPSPVVAPGDAPMEYDDLPDLQEVQEVQEEVLSVYPVAVGVSHQERHVHTPPPDSLWLTQLAHIATGPQSPLLQEAPPSSSSLTCLSTTTCNLHSYARPPPPPPPSGSTAAPPGGHSRERRRSRRSSECGSAVSTRSSLSDDEDMGWSFSWPPTAWHCFLKGTHLRLHSGANVEWQDVEHLDSAEEDSSDEQSTFLKSYGSEGLQLVEHSEIVLSNQAVLQLTFDPGAFGHAPMSARCQLDHPFYVKNKGWSSFYPSLTVVRHGIPCYEMAVGDVCLPQGHREAKHSDSSQVFDTFRSYDFTPLDSSAVYVLSSMARRRRASQSSGSPDRDAGRGELLLHAGSKQPHARTAAGRLRVCVTPAGAHGPPRSHSPQQKPKRSSAGSSDATPTKCKRPMNAFMLFAKKFRVEYTQMYPGKDNRAISVLLGERWKKMRSEERRAFTVQAKALADEQKRLNPDCWKRKRSNSGCQGN